MQRLQNGKWTAQLVAAVLMALVLGSSARAEVYGWWKLDDGAGDTAKDSGPRGVDGEVNNFDFGGLGDDGSVWVDDPERGTVISFNGDGDGAFVFAGYLPLMTLDNDFTWAFWAKPDEEQATPANDIIIGNRYSDDGSDFDPRQFIKFTMNRFEYHMNGGFVDDLEYLDCDGCIERHIPNDPPEWMHHTVVKDGNQLAYYRDGELWNEKEIVQEMSEEMPFFMGGDYFGRAGENWRGYLSDVRLFDHALTEQEVLEIMGGITGDPGDFDGNGQLDVADIDALTQEVRSGTNNARFDLTSDGLVDQQDRSAWVEDLKKTYFGDANLDGEFNSSDFVQVFQAGHFEDTEANNSTWGTGDWNGDSEFNSSDFVLAFQSGGFEQGPRAAVQAVPEPTGGLMLLAGALLAAHSCRRRR